MQGDWSYIHYKVAVANKLPTPIQVRLIMEESEVLSSTIFHSPTTSINTIMDFCEDCNLQLTTELYKREEKMWEKKKEKKPHIWMTSLNFL